MRYSRLAIVCGALALMGLGFHWCRTEARIDECLDSGGKWSGKQCEH